MGFKIKSFKKAIRKVRSAPKKLGLSKKRFNNLLGRRDHGSSVLASSQSTSALSQRRISDLARSF